MEHLIGILTAIAPVLVAAITIIPAIISNRKKTQNSIKEVQSSVETLQKTLDAHIKEDEDDKARTQRYRILRFYDEMCEGKNHSESHFEDILDDITDYETYCAKHPNFRNSRGAIAMEAVQDTFKRVKLKGGFLTHNEGE